MTKQGKVGDICIILDKRRIPVTASNRKPGPYPYYGANGVQGYVADFIFDGEYVLVAEDGGNFGSKEKPIAYRVSGKCWVNNHAHILEPKEFIDVDYLFYALAFYDTTGLVNGSTRQKLTQSDLRKMIITYPEELSTQKKIANKLKKYLSFIDGLTKKTELQIKEMEAYIERLIKDFLIEPQADDWRTGTIKDYAIINPSARELSEKPKDDCLVSFVPMSAVSAEEGRITDRIAKTYAEVKKGYTYFVEDDIIFAKITPCMQNGKIAVAKNLNNGIGFGSTEFHVIRANEVIMPEWLYYLFRRKSYLETAATKMQGAVGQQRLPDTFIRETIITFPKSVDKQKEITSSLSEEINRTATLIKKLRKQHNNIANLRVCVFKEAFGSEE